MISLLLHSYLTNALLRLVTGQIFFLTKLRSAERTERKKKISKQLFYNIERDHRFNRHDTPSDFFLLFFPFLLLATLSYYSDSITNYQIFFLSKQFNINIFRYILPNKHMYTTRKRLKRGISLNNTRTTTIHVECSVVTDLKILLL